MPNVTRRNSGPWNVLLGQLKPIIDKVFGKVVAAPTARHRAANFFGGRAMDHCIALAVLFERGLYPDSKLVIRSMYEDWIAAAYVLVRPGQERAQRFWEDEKKHLAKQYKGLRGLVGEKVAREIVGEHLKGYENLVGNSNRELKPFDGATWQEMASDVGLEKLHELVYSSLSSLAHGAILNMREMFEEGPDGIGVATMSRDPAREGEFAFWAFWFALRTLTIAAREWGHQLEAETDKVLRELPSQRWARSVAVRERLPGT